MSSSNFHIIQTAVYLLVIGILCVMMRPPAETRLYIFDAHYDRTIAQKPSEMDSILKVMYERMNERGNYEKVRPYYERALFVDSLTKQLIASISDKFPKRVLTVYQKAALQSDIRASVARYVNEVLVTVPSDSSFLRSYINQKILPGSETFEQHVTVGSFMNELEKGGHTQTERRILMSVVYDVALIVQHRLNMLSRIIFCGFDSLFIAAIPKSTYFELGEKVSTKIIFTYAFTNNNLRYFSFYQNGKHIDGTNGVARIEEIASQVGWHRVEGVAVVRPRYNRKPYDTIPWFFHYHVSKPNVSLRVDREYVLHRNVVNHFGISRGGEVCRNLSVRAKGARVGHCGNGKYSIVITDKNADSISLNIQEKSESGYVYTEYNISVPVSSFSPVPVLKIANSASGLLSIGQLTHAQGLKAVFEDMEAGCAVTGFELTIISGEGKHSGTYAINGSSWKNDTTAARMVRQLQAGDKLYFYNATAKTEAGDIVSPAPLIITMK